jgi:aspartyl-tRNA(Asn)/glutamyl-tRNA(Gln) amidotransferase subunit B
MKLEYKTTIGLEIHAELKTKTKMFCDCLNDPNEEKPNVNICPVCTGHPGTLPTINKEAVMAVIKLGLSLGGKISTHTKFDRKNYFYPDLPKGYQISQYDNPLVEGGKLMGVQLTRVHLEEDTANLSHTDANNDYSLVNFNRSSVPLMELVTEPSINSSEEAFSFAKELQLILRYLNVSTADMEKGEMRVEANISVSKDEKLGTKVEVKNINSFKAVKNAIDYEVDRQIKALEQGEKIVQETRGWDENRSQTFSQRKKEEAHDYRYMPEPDLPPLNISESEIEKVRFTIPELPEGKRKRFTEEYQLPAEDIKILILDKKISDYFEKAVSELDGWICDKNLPQKGKEHLRMIKMTVNYLMGDVQYLISRSGDKEKTFFETITPENFAEFVTIVFEGKISSAAAKTVLEEMFDTGADPSNIIEEKGLIQESDEGALGAVVDDIIKNNQGPAGDYKKGKEQALQFLVGQVMKITKGKANPQVISKLFKEKLK